MHDLLCPSKKLRFKVSSKPLVDFETISAIRKREESLKKKQKTWLKNKWFTQHTNNDWQKQLSDSMIF